jgi:FkbM family methyltransferase
MLRHARVIAADFLGLCRVCGIVVACRWLLAVATHFAACRKVGHLQVADAAMGPGPFTVTLRKARAVLEGERIMTGIREIWVRDPYLANFLAIPPDGKVVDLGANMGIFTAQAVAQGDRVKVVAVEADPRECDHLRQTLADNHADSRADVLNGFIGGITGFQTDLKATDRAAKVTTISESEILSCLGGGPIDLLKCDIEGSEFALFANPGPLLAATRQIAMELHPACGDVDAIIARLRQMGFELQIQNQHPTVLVRARRNLPAAHSRTQGTDQA